MAALSNSSSDYHGASALTTVVFGLLVASERGAKSLRVNDEFLFTIGINRIGGGVTRSV